MTARWTFFSPTARNYPKCKDGPFLLQLPAPQQGDGTFEDVTEKAGLTGANLGYSMGVAAADYDNDGNEDLFICNAGRDALYHNNGDGTFTDVTEVRGSTTNPANV